MRGYTKPELRGINIQIPGGMKAILAHTCNLLIQDFEKRHPTIKVPRETIIAAVESFASLILENLPLEGNPDWNRNTKLIMEITAELLHHFIKIMLQDSSIPSLMEANGWASEIFNTISKHPVNRELLNREIDLPKRPSRL